jgi:hypothetical protein
MDFTRRHFLALPLAIQPLTPPPGIGTRLAPELREYKDAETGRAIRQFTSARANSYPLYYFIPTVTADGRYAVLHSERSGWVQLYRLELATGAMAQLTAGTTRDSGWFIWCEGHLRGIFNHLSALNQASGEVWYFQDEELRATNVETFSNRRVLGLEGRRPMGQAAFSPDGKTFAFIHADARLMRERMADLDSLSNMGMGWWNSNWRQTIPTVIGVVDTATGRYRDVIRLDYHVHHVIFGSSTTLLVNHLTTGPGMWRIETDGTGRRDVRVLDHQVVTARGIFYEMPDGKGGNRLGRCVLATGECKEVPLAGGEGYVHVGSDAAGRLLFFEVAGKRHELRLFDARRGESRLIRTLAAYPKPQQRYHGHPFLSADRKWIYHTAVVDGFSQFSAVKVEDLSGGTEEPAL